MPSPHYGDFCRKQVPRLEPDISISGDVVAPRIDVDVGISDGDRHRQLAYAPGEVRFVDSRRIPAPRPAFSGHFKCTAKPPGC